MTIKSKYLSYLNQSKIINTQILSFNTQKIIVGWSRSFVGVRLVLIHGVVFGLLDVLLRGGGVVGLGRIEFVSSSVLAHANE